MSPLTQILAPVDFSPPARHAAERAARLAHECGAALDLLHVLPQGGLTELRHWLGSEHVGAQLLRDQALAQLEVLGAQLCERRQARVGVRLAEGSVLHEVLHAAAAQAAELLVLGARGEGYLRRLMLGSTAQRLLYRSEQPLLMVRQAPHAPYRRVLVGVDFSAYTEPVLAWSRRVAPHAQQVWVAHVFQVPFEDKLRLAGVDDATVAHYRQATRTQALGRASELARRWPGQHAQAAVVEGEAWLRLLELELEHDCDLVVLGKQGQSALQDALLGSVTQHVYAEGAADLLVVPGTG